MEMKSLNQLSERKLKDFGYKFLILWGHLQKHSLHIFVVKTIRHKSHFCQLTINGV